MIAECLKIAFADRFKYMGDPATVEIPLDWLTSKAYGVERRAGIDMSVAVPQAAGIRIHSYALGTQALTRPIAATEIARVTLGTFTPVLEPGAIVSIAEGTANGGHAEMTHDCSPARQSPPQPRLRRHEKPQRRTP